MPGSLSLVAFRRQSCRPQGVLFSFAYQPVCCRPGARRGGTMGCRAGAARRGARCACRRWRSALRTCALRRRASKALNPVPAMPGPTELTAKVAAELGPLTQRLPRRSGVGHLTLRQVRRISSCGGLAHDTCRCAQGQQRLGRLLSDVPLFNFAVYVTLPASPCFYHGRFCGIRLPACPPQNAPQAKHGALLGRELSARRPCPPGPAFMHGRLQDPTACLPCAHCAAPMAWSYVDGTSPPALPAL